MIVMDCNPTDRTRERLDDPIAYKVAVEKAAEAFAVARGWDWPSLKGYAVDPAIDLQLARIEARQHIRQYAKVMVEAFVRHLREGGIDHNPHAEIECASFIAAQNTEDRMQSEVLKRLRLVVGFRGGRDAS